MKQSPSPRTLSTLASIGLGILASQHPDCSGASIDIDKIAVSTNAKLKRCLDDTRKGVGEAGRLLNFLITHPEKQELFILSRQAFERWVGGPKIGLSFEEDRCAIRFEDISGLKCIDLGGDGVWETTEGGQYDGQLTRRGIQKECNDKFKNAMRGYDSSYGG